MLALRLQQGSEADKLGDWNTGMTGDVADMVLPRLQRYCTVLLFLNECYTTAHSFPSSLPLWARTRPGRGIPVER
jgi:hypothetical protein